MAERPVRAMCAGCGSEITPGAPNPNAFTGARPTAAFVATPLDRIEAFRARGGENSSPRAPPGVALVGDYVAVGLVVGGVSRLERMVAARLTTIREISGNSHLRKNSNLRSSDALPSNPASAGLASRIVSSL